MQVRSLDQEDPQEEHMATRSSILVWRIPVSQTVTEESAASQTLTEGLKESDVAEAT